MKEHFIIDDDVLVRKFTDDDLEDLFIVMTNRESMKNSTRQPLSINETRSFLDRIINSYRKFNYGLYALESALRGNLIGYCGFSYINIDSRPETEISIRLLPQYWGKGIGSKAVKIISDYGFNKLKIDKITAIVSFENTAWEKVCINAGLKFKKNSVLHNIQIKIFEKELSSKVFFI
ncbi:MAG: GNAT family N-acetyltransferase [Candidatus Muirbacterium halophilum]|nr:GNAT family N-acetyltransferase [Candidatus Muirbacterium halophilum]MCK9474282.1 GNAT family N-acetyltransferase [Candidatus Muirbacterium halophilum]